MAAPEYLIDLSKPPAERFDEVAQDYKGTLKTLIGKLRKTYLSEQTVTGKLKGFVASKGSVWLLHCYADHPYIQEVIGFANAAGVAAEDLYLANLVYDLNSHLRLPGVACTGFVHGGPPYPLIARAMDWIIPQGIGKHSMVLRFKGKGFEFLSVGFPGITGVISGLSSRGFAITVNQKCVDATVSAPSISMPVLWHVRNALEHCKSFAAAKRLLVEEETASSAFYLLCGSKPGESCLIESDGDSTEIAMVSKGAIQAIANHSPFDDGEDAVDIDVGSTFHRYQAIKKRAEALKTADTAAATKTLSRFPVYHSDTVHQMVLCPAEGTLRLRCPQSGEKRYKTSTLENKKV